MDTEYHINNTYNYQTVKQNVLRIKIKCMITVDCITLKLTKNFQVSKMSVKIVRFYKLNCAQTLNNILRTNKFAEVGHSDLHSTKS